MKQKKELNELEICKEYQNGRNGVNTLCKKYHVGKLRIKEILKAHNIEFKKCGKQELKEEFVVSDWKIEKFPIVEGSYYIAVDKNNGFTTKDYMNSAGVLTTHIKKCYGTSYSTRKLHYMSQFAEEFSIAEIMHQLGAQIPYGAIIIMRKSREQH